MSHLAMNHATNVPRRSFLALLVSVAIVAGGCDFAQDLGGGNNDEAALFPVLLDGDYGYVDAEGRIVIEPQFHWASYFSEGKAVVKTNCCSYGFIDTSGELVIEPRFDGARNFSQGRAAVRFDGRWGYIDGGGSFAINPQFNSAGQFSDDRAFVRTANWDWEYVNRSGLIVRTEETPSFDENDENAFVGGVALVRQNDSFGYIDESTVPVIPLQYAEARAFSDGRAAIKISDRWGYIDTRTNTVITPQFISAGKFGDGLAPVRKTGNFWGYINTSGTLVIEEQFEEANEFSEGRAAVRIDGRWAYINENGDRITDAVFDEAEPFKLGLGRVVQLVGEDERVGYVDRAGRYVWYPTD